MEPSENVQVQEPPRKTHARAARALDMTMAMILGAGLMMLFFFMTTPTMELQARVLAVDENGLVTLGFSSMYSDAVAAHLDNGVLLTLRGYVIVYSVQSGQPHFTTTRLPFTIPGGENNG